MDTTYPYLAAASILAVRLVNQTGKPQRDRKRGAPWGKQLGRRGWRGLAGLRGAGAARKTGGTGATGGHPLLVRVKEQPYAQTLQGNGSTGVHWVTYHKVTLLWFTQPLSSILLGKTRNVLFHFYPARGRWSLVTGPSYGNQR